MVPFTYCLSTDEPESQFCADVNEINFTEGTGLDRLITGDGSLVEAGIEFFLHPGEGDLFDIPNTNEDYFAV